MHIHILGICGTFMAGIAELAVQLGHRVTGSDADVYPPMSTFLSRQGIDIHTGYDVAQLQPTPDLVLIGNALSRGNEAVEQVLNRHIRYLSGPQWLAEEVLLSRHVIAVSGTHGKTTTTSILTWILDQCGLAPGYLIGGIAQDFESPATLGDGRYFVIEADEYDTAFFDKRSKFIHYRPDTLIINNLEYDHADIFPDLEAIKRQFHHLLRIVPASGLVIFPSADNDIEDVLQRGCWSRRQSFGFSADGDWQIVDFKQRATAQFKINCESNGCVLVTSPLIGQHNALNATAALRAAVDIGIPFADAIAALASFGGVKRRLEVIGVINQITVYDDFAHHPTAIRATLEALRASVGNQRIICILEPRSNTMRMGVHAVQIASALQQANEVYLLRSKNLSWDPSVLFDGLNANPHIFSSVEEILKSVVPLANHGDHIVIMSNGGFANIHSRLIDGLKQRRDDRHQ